MRKIKLPNTRAKNTTTPVAIPPMVAAGSLLLEPTVDNAESVLIVEVVVAPMVVVDTFEVVPVSPVPTSLIRLAHASSTLESVFATPFMSEVQGLPSVCSNQLIAHEYLSVEVQML